MFSDNDSDTTDDEMPPLEIAETTTTTATTSPSNASPSSSTSAGGDAATITVPRNNTTSSSVNGSITPTRRIIRAVRPKTTSRNLAGGYSSSTSGDNNDGGSTTPNFFANPGDNNNNDTTNSTSNVPLAVNWNLFPTTTTTATQQQQQQQQANGPTSTGSFNDASSGRPFVMTSASSSSGANGNNIINNSNNSNNENNDEDEDEDEESNDNPNRKRKGNSFAALQTESSSSDDDDDEAGAFSEEEEEEEDDDDEVLSYHSSEYEFDDDDDDDDDDGPGGGPPEMPRGMLNFFRMMSQMASDNDDDDDDDDDDSEPCTCPHCLMERFGCDNDDSDAANDEDAEPPLDPNAAPCAICLEPETASRQFVHLPCCGIGNNFQESTSSTRFCQKCLVRYMAKNGSGVPKTTAQSTRGMLAGECPRCKHLLTLQEEEKSTTTTGFDFRPYYKRTHPMKASVTSLFWYIGRKDGGQYRVYLLTIGWCSPHYIPEELLLNDRGSHVAIDHLCQWGLLHKIKSSAVTTSSNDNNNKNNNAASSYLADWTKRCHKKLHQIMPNTISDPDSSSSDSNSSSGSSLPNTAGWVYRVDPQMHMELRQLLLEHLEIDDDLELALRLTTSSSSSGGGGSEEKQEENGRKHCFMVSCNCAASAWMALCKFRIGRAILVANRGFSLTLLSSKTLLPPVSEWPKSFPPWFRFVMSLNASLSSSSSSSDGQQPSSSDTPTSNESTTAEAVRCHEVCWNALTVLNLILLAVTLRILQQALWIAVYLAQGFLICQFVGSCLVTPKSLWKRWLRNASSLYALTYGLYRFWWWCCRSSISDQVGDDHDGSFVDVAVSGGMLKEEF